MTEDDDTKAFRIEEVEIDNLTISEFNERTGSVAPDKELAEDIRENGIQDPLLVRPHDGDEADYEVVAGQRRYNTAFEEGFNTVPVRIRDMSDMEAAVASTRENYRGQLGTDVGFTERAAQMWKATQASEYEEVASTYLADEFGVPKSTMSRWVEPLAEDWKNTPVDPRFKVSEDLEEFHGETVDNNLIQEDGSWEIMGEVFVRSMDLNEVGGSKLAFIRKMDASVPDRVRLVQAVSQNDITRSSLVALKSLIDADDASISDFLESDYYDTDNYKANLQQYVNSIRDGDGDSEEESISDDQSGEVSEADDDSGVNETREETTTGQNKRSNKSNGGGPGSSSTFIKDRSEEGDEESDETSGDSDTEDQGDSSSVGDTSSEGEGSSFTDEIEEQQDDNEESKSVSANSSEGRKVAQKASTGDSDGKRIQVVMELDASGIFNGKKKAKKGVTESETLVDSNAEIVRAYKPDSDNEDSVVIK